MTDVRFYEPQLVEIKAPEPGEFRISSAAVRSCSLCGTMISGMGGPGDAPICERCIEPLRRGELRGCVKWQDETDTGS